MLIQAKCSQHPQPGNTESLTTPRWGRREGGDPEEGRENTSFFLLLLPPSPSGPSKSIFVACPAARSGWGGGGGGRLGQTLCRNSPANSNTVQPSRATTKLTWPGLAGWLRTPSGRGHDTERQLERRTCCDKKARDGGGGDFKEQPHCGKAARKHKVFVSRPKAHGSDRLPFGHLFAELPSIPCWCLLHTVRANSPQSFPS